MSREADLLPVPPAWARLYDHAVLPVYTVLFYREPKPRGPHCKAAQSVIPVTAQHMSLCGHRGCRGATPARVMARPLKAQPSDMPSKKSNGAKFSSSGVDRRLSRPCQVLSSSAGAKPPSPSACMPARSLPQLPLHGGRADHAMQSPAGI